ncbi:hypothetical protein SAMN05421780_104271 [Flexibacter flexilis DSM 6793]|uniref:Uncharacterized protein n=1 Tax=Flexibacter flexilis DSM 6793 TaxID=927664 RepID=A0A1I1IAD6_9BACT|nr:hypothetical protein [Flexibacter flexilis]SFC32752.1 hypothetical protein SAMN05421780_104271 [Flexibacter flexilis DSM 6793]
MKISLFSKFVWLWLLLLAGHVSFAQCDDKSIRKHCKTSLGHYIFETADYKPYSTFAKKDYLEAEFSAYEGENYRIVNLCSGFAEDVEFTIIAPDKTELFTNAKGKSVKHFDFSASQTGDYTIRFKFSSSAKTQASCVAYAVGYK